MAPGRPPLHSDLLGHLVGRDSGHGIPDRTGDLVIGFRRGTLRRRGPDCADAQFGQRAVDLRLTGRIGSGRQRLAVAAVALQPVPEGREGERLEQIRQCTMAHGGAHHLQIAFGGDRNDVRRRPQARQARRQRDPVRVGQSNIKQHQVDWCLGGYGFGCRAHRIAGGVRDGCDRKAGKPTEIRAMRLGDQRLVLDDQHVDHDVTVTVTTDPYVTSAVSVPLCRFTTWATSASPRPCCSPSEPDFVEYPRRMAFSKVPSSMPGPLSAARISSVSLCWLTVTSIHGSSRSHASIALSIRLPSTVTISWPDSARSSAFDGRWVSSVTVNSMPRSSACAVLPSSSATRAGSPTALESRSTNCCDSSSSLVANVTASSARPISTIVTMVCSLLTASCACDRSVSVSTLSELSSPSAPCNSVRSRMVTTSESRGASSTSDRLTTSTRSSVTCTSSRAPGL